MVNRLHADEMYDSTINNTSMVQLGHNIIKVTLAYHLYVVIPDRDPGTFPTSSLIMP